MKKIKAIDLINNSKLTDDYFAEAESYFQVLDKLYTDIINDIECGKEIIEQTTYLKQQLKNERTNNQSSDQQKENTFLQEETKEKE